MRDAGIHHQQLGALIFVCLSQSKVKDAVEEETLNQLDQKHLSSRGSQFVGNAA